jgi:hypothetical protein
MRVAAIPDRRIDGIDEMVKNADFILDGIGDLPELVSSL